MDSDIDVARQVLPAAPTSAREARQLVVDFLAERGQFRPLEPAAVIVTELVANAVLFGRAESIEIDVELTASHVRIRVHDDNPEPPSRRLAAAATDCFGRGLALIEAMSTRWGVLTEPAGKWVWAELPR